MLGLDVRSVARNLCLVKMMDFTHDGFYSCSSVQVYLGVISSKVGLFEHLMWVNKRWGIQCSELGAYFAFSSSVLFGQLCPTCSACSCFPAGWLLKRRALLQQSDTFCLPSKPAIILAGSPIDARGSFAGVGRWVGSSCFNMKLLLQGSGSSRNWMPPQLLKSNPPLVWSIVLPNPPFSELGHLPRARTSSSE